MYLAICRRNHDQAPSALIQTGFKSLRPSDAYICVGNLTIIGRRQAIPWTKAGILLKWHWARNKLRWNFNWNSNIFIEENAFETVVWKMAAILSRSQCVKRFMRQHNTVAYIWMLTTFLSKPKKSQTSSVNCITKWHTFGWQIYP